MCCTTWQTFLTSCSCEVVSSIKAANNFRREVNPSTLGGMTGLKGHGGAVTRKTESSNAATLQDTQQKNLSQNGHGLFHGCSNPHNTGIPTAITCDARGALHLLMNKTMEVSVKWYSLVYCWKLPYDTKYCFRPGNQASGSDFGRILVCKASESAPRPAGGPILKLSRLESSRNPGRKLDY